MAVEIERRFVIRGDAWRGGAAPAHLKQGYFASEGVLTWRVRLRLDTREAWLTIKAPGDGLSRPEYEWGIPFVEAEELIVYCEERVVEKLRYEREFAGHLWVVDEFLGLNEGLLLAEVELEAADEEVELPEWVGSEITGRPEWSNQALAIKPWGRRSRSERDCLFD